MGTDRDDLVRRVADTLVARDLDHPLRVAVDGITASGKSTFADDLDAAAHDLLVPLGPDGSLRYRERITDLESDEVVDDWRTASADAVMIVDGSFLMRQELREHWDEVIFLDVAFEVALDRGVEREASAFGGVGAAREALELRYHAAGRRYLAEVDPLRHATIVVGLDDPEQPVWRRRSRPAGDFDYERHGTGYVRRRQPDPRIAALVDDALGDARTVLNVGAGAGSYEPADRYVVAVEPAAAMRAQRPSTSPPAIDAAAERLPFDDDSFDAAMATITIHQWSDLDAGLKEMRRVARGPVVILTFDGPALEKLWLNDYVPEVIATERVRFPTLEHVAEVLGGTVEIHTVPIPHDCTDGFGEAYYARPEAFLEEDVRAAQSGWVLTDPQRVAAGVARLAADLRSGAWDERYGHLRTQPEYVGAVRLLVARP